MAAEGLAGCQAVADVGLGAGLPDSIRKQMVWWLGTCSAWVFGLVVLGGITRLTRSGLSMTDWKFTGERPPLSDEDWEVEFSKYQQSPEFKKVHSYMTVEDFKFIYWMEYSHRMWGRALGLVFGVPALYFASRGCLKGALGQRLGLLFLMGGTQGLVGWWMVRSGLKESEDHQVPRVSPYRLAAHLTSAFAIYATLVYTTLSLAQTAPAAMGPAVQQLVGRFRSHWVLPVSVLVGCTAVSGAFVAGLDAGRAYNTFPLMNGQWVPEEYFDMPGWRNAFENTAAVQLHHRVLAITTLSAVAGLWMVGRGLPLPPLSRRLLDASAVMTMAQVTLGITTLLTYVPPSLGTAHQAGALTLFTLLLALLHSLRPMNPAAITLAWQRWVHPAAAAATMGIGVAVTQTQ